jgi:hypothetical protein
MIAISASRAIVDSTGDFRASGCGAARIAADSVHHTTVPARPRA